MTTQTKTANKEILEGVNGKGHTIYCVFVKQPNGREFIHRFETKAEAEHWVKWA